jgi:putative Mn2+ efflux pump MntP
MDAFAIAVCIGLALPKANIKNALTVGLYFGAFQAGMPLVGYFAASFFADRVAAYSYFAAFGLLCFLGGKMIYESLKKAACREYALSAPNMLALALATSIDALAVGVSFAFLQVRILPAVLLIGLTTLAISMAGVKLGNLFGSAFKKKAQWVGGMILILIGIKILVDHL